MPDCELSRAELDRRWHLVLPFRERALRVARGRVPAADVEDLANEAMLRVVTMPRLEEARLGGLISTITMRLAVDHHRREQTARLLEQRRAGVASDQCASEEVCDRAEAAWLARQTARLNEQDREVLLHRAAGHSAASAASELGISYKSAGSAFTRARGEMKALWQSTLGVLGCIGVYLRRVSPRGVIAAPVVAVVSSCLLLAPVWEALEAGKPSAPPPSTHATAQLKQAPSHHSTPKAVASQPASIVSPRPSAILSTGTLANQRLPRSGVRIENRDRDRSLFETLNECLTYGLILQPSHVDCRSPNSR